MEESGQNEAPETLRISAVPEFAQIYSFLDYFGRFLGLPPLPLSDLETFFRSGYRSVDSPVTLVHWQLLSTVCRREGRAQWQHMAAKFAKKCGVVEERIPYDHLTPHQRVKVFLCSCERQFDYSVGLRNALKKIPPEQLHTPPTGVDSNGRRHWLLRDATHDVRLYGESNYAEAPPKRATWIELARSLDELGAYIFSLDPSHPPTLTPPPAAHPSSHTQHAFNSEPTNSVTHRGEESSESSGLKQTEEPISVSVPPTSIPSLPAVANSDESVAITITEEEKERGRGSVDSVNKDVTMTKEEEEEESEGIAITKEEESEGIAITTEEREEEEEEGGGGGGTDSVRPAATATSSVVSTAAVAMARGGRRRTAVNYSATGSITAATTTAAAAAAGATGGATGGAKVRGSARKNAKSPAVVKKNKRRSGKGRGSVAMETEQTMKPEIGCMKCCRDVNYKQLLLCDECDAECHTYCQYPVLYEVPRGKWVCPMCNEKRLVAVLRKVYTELAEARAVHNRAAAKKQKSVERLQRSGLLLQNILGSELEAGSGSRARRAKKTINYAELNDIYLPPLGPQDYVGGEVLRGHPRQARVKTRSRYNDVYIQEDYLAPRMRTTSRRLLDIREEEGEQEEEGEGENQSTGTEEGSRGRSDDEELLEMGYQSYKHPRLCDDDVLAGTATVEGFDPTVSGGEESDSEVCVVSDDGSSSGGDEAGPLHTDLSCNTSITHQQSFTPSPPPPPPQILANDRRADQSSPSPLNGKAVLSFSEHLSQDS